ncbi:UDP-N-acetylmuramoyl-L-alanine--D-glutamate ligase [Lacrimispora algidixylanolytica]|uniref:UDP-N-acetylmuramoylalanine--D-glutamate ligase n=1 Tax=Lacrimispora algidixylanolytica TaxID=94868 RepID=A0A419T211_9FIRM|nr:UDP-N-acetylmuramoyl-L-alanine--D-glutamate ligase [Lacrimispora algidixylanolytica]RKD31505.1 UDP-N-acetylmuramoylalanine--D-glutamate ligase [Lacrimispora algidixylanolytica]
MSQKILVAGSGKSGIAASRLILKTGDEVILYDSNDALNKDELSEQFKEEGTFSVLLGELKKEDIKDIDLCVISPGIPLDAPFVSVLRDGDIPIWSEIQLAYHHAKGKLFAITGTNGKTTTTALTGEIMKAFYAEVFVVGNIGIPYTEEALKTTTDSVTVAEISSFQLETITDFKPEVSAILNITPDHLNRHKTMDCYIKIKESITKNQGDQEVCVLNYDDPVLREFGNSIKAKAVFFSSRVVLDEGYCLDGDMIIRNHNGERYEIVSVKELKLLGRHNHENVMAAIAIAVEALVPIEVIRNAVCEFKAVEHRIEFVAEKSGVKYYNDSKGTNPDAAIQAVKAMPGSTILIAGGYDKNSEYDEWIRSFDGKVRYMVLLGQTREKIAECAARQGFTNVMYAEDMQEAVRVCASYANIGDYVLLSPACASWGMFKCYEERGDIFKECVRNL